ncbi:MAG TPA: ABC transporter permease [Candidatus Acidoferrales bacterium]|jgi:predicted permease|nr:ABC transporter permease [Candidatus Acidoferrales bacterium]
MGSLRQNIRYAVRMLVRNPGFSAAAVLCLALGIGATTAIFSVVNAVLLRQLPYASPARLVRVFSEFPTFSSGGLRHFWISPPEYFDLKRDVAAFDAMEGWTNRGVNLAGANEPVRATASFVTGGMLPMLGVAPALGRVLTPEDDKPNAPLTAVLSYGLWQRGYGGDPTVLGRDIRFNGNACTVVGVMPGSFSFPPGELNPSELWVPMQLDPVKPGSRGSHFVNVLARLGAQTSLFHAEAETQRYVRSVAVPQGAGVHGFDPKFHPIVLAGFQDEIVRSVRRAMLVLLGAVAFVLLIACVNVANLLLARAEARRREIAVRAAIGASLGNLLQQFVIEGLLLSLTGGLFGILLAFGGLRLLVATNAGSIPRVDEVNIDWQVLLFTLAVSIATGIAFGLAPVIHMRAGKLHDTLKTAAGRTTGAAAAGRFRAALVSAELALALILLIGSGLMVKAFWKLQEVDAGINPNHVVTMTLSLPGTSYKDGTATTGFWQGLLARVQSLPGVVSVAMASGLPPNRSINANDTPIENFVPVPNGPMQNIDYWNFVGPHYFDAMGARLVEGRLLTDSDGPTAPAVVVVNQSLAQTYWPHESALGHRLKTEFGADAKWRRIVGVIGDIKNAGLDQAAGTELYVAYSQYPNPSRLASLVVRTTGDPMSLVGAIRGQIQAMDRALPISQIRSMDEVMSVARSRPRFLTLLLTLFSSLSLILAALGIYGVISYSVAQRTNEIGIRMALGAQRGDVLRLVGVTGIRLALAGTTIGAIGAFALTRFLSGLLFGVSSADVGTFAAMAAMLIAVTLLACYIPARRASKVDPLIALRYE